MAENGSKKEVMQAIEKIRRDWQRDVNESLVDVNVSLGVFLSDLAEAFSLSQAETRQVLGARLYKDVDALVNDK